MEFPAFLSLNGPLGSGKTYFTSCFAQRLGASASSPTYTLVNEYDSKKGKIVHIDAYRISSRDDLESIGFFDYLDRGCIMIVEWGENIKEFLPRKRLDIFLDYSGNKREIRCSYYP